MASYMYVLVYNGAEWEDIQLYDNLEDATNELNRMKNTTKHIFVQNYRIEIFEKKQKQNVLFLPIKTYDLKWEENETV